MPMVEENWHSNNHEDTQCGWIQETGCELLDYPVWTSTLCEQVPLASSTHSASSEISAGSLLFRV